MNIQIRYGVAVFNKAVPQGTTAGQIRRDANIKAGLGFGDNVKITQHGVELPDNALIGEGAELVVETAANTKAQAEQVVRVRYGVSTLERNYRYGVTVGEVMDDDSLRAALGYGDNIKVSINGIEMPEDAIVPNAATLVIETAANTKAVPA